MLHYNEVETCGNVIVGQKDVMFNMNWFVMVQPEEVNQSDNAH